MLYMFLLYWNQDDGPDPSDDIMERHFAVLRRAQQNNAYICSEAIGGTDGATTVRVRAGKPTLTDGPYAEAKEVMGGFYILDCKDLDEALDYAAQIPDASHGAVEVRAVRFVPGWPYSIGADRERAPFE